jgi:hypothetical protein
MSTITGRTLARWERQQDRYERSRGAEYTRERRQYMRLLHRDRMLQARNERIEGTCSNCRKPLKGTGANNARYCLDCWLNGFALYREGVPVQDIVVWNFPLVTEKAFRRKLYKLRRNFKEHDMLDTAMLLQRA